MVVNKPARAVVQVWRRNTGHFGVYQMIEDSLKTTRNLHRLIVSVSAASIVFAMSLSVSDIKYEQWLDLKVLHSLSFKGYDEFAQEALASYARETLQPLSKQAISGLDKNLFRDEDLSKIAAAIETPLVNNMTWVEGGFAGKWPEEPTLTQCLQFGRSPRALADIRVLVPRIEGVSGRMNDLFRSARLGQQNSIERVGLGPRDGALDFPEVPPGESCGVSIYFSLASDVADSENLSIELTGELADSFMIPNTSFISWLERHEGARRLYRIEDGNLYWLPGLRDLSEDTRAEKVVTLTDQYSQELERGGPQQKSISVLGIEVPGILFTYSGPLVLLVLLYYFLNHLAHLKALAGGGDELFRQFAWMPLALGKGWWWEALGTCVALPVGSVALLFYKLIQVYSMTVMTGLIMTGAGLGVGWLGWCSCLGIERLRTTIRISDRQNS